MEDAENAENVRKLSHLIRSTGPRKLLVSEIVMDQNGSPICSNSAGHLLPPIQNPGLQQKEVSDSISLLKRHHAAGPDDLTLALFKDGDGLLSQCLSSLFGSIWEKETIPDNWGESNFTKGNRSECINHRASNIIRRTLWLFGSEASVSTLMLLSLMLMIITTDVIMRLVDGRNPHKKSSTPYNRLWLVADETSPDWYPTWSHECSLFVGELTEDVDDLALFNAFKKYPTCRSAKVVMTNGKSRGYGFVRFLTESDMDKALIEMQNYCGLGYKPIRVSLAIPKRYNADGSVAVTTSSSETTSSIVPSGMPDPFTAAVAAAVTGSSAAQAEYYQAYQQYYQQYYASQYAAQFYGTSSAGEAGTTSSGGLTATANNLSTTSVSSCVPGESVVQQHAMLDANASELYARALARAQAMCSQEYSPEPYVLSSAFDRPRHVDDLDEVYGFLEASRWHITDPSLGLFVKIHP
ncbi:tRNA selenocysteine 1-associated protein 1 [Clonorchis sinensis]|uniref:tRNA selenocysteine-associated protein 1 n=1 Tax=Clonorchis sinensis TaxID=79923 RepID=H2KNF3_CLOSI|nr:tRNA selenocysteine 1-associated protein 1 [Clonorchis sinensis]